MKIALIGYMTSGKSSVGKLLASQMKLQYIDLDNFIEQEEEMTIPEIFKIKGELYFRKKEMEHLKKLLYKKEDYCISTGGGTPCYGNNMQLIKKLTKSVYLQTSVKEIYSRLKIGKSKRPLVAHLSDEELLEFVGKHLFERVPFYKQADFTVSTDGKSTTEVVTAIKKCL